MATIAADVVVIGGGPAGCLTAIGAIQSDPTLDVVVVEPHTENRHRIGEALLTGTVMTLDDAGLADEVAAAGFHRKIGAAYVWGKTRDPWYVNYPPEAMAYPSAFRDGNGRYTIHVPRHEYDRLLASLAEARGVRFVRQQASEVEVSETSGGKAVRHVTLKDGTKLYGKHYVDCSGQSCFLGRRVTERLPVGMPRVARYAYTSDIDWDMAGRNGFDPHRTNIISDANGWFWVIHLGDAGGGLTSFGFVSTPEIVSRLTFENFIEAFPLAQKFGVGKNGYPNPKTFDGKKAEKFYGHPDYSFSCVDLHGVNWALAGDAALFIDPILSQGVTLASHYGFLRGKAAAAMLNGHEDAHAEVTKHYRNEAAIMHDVVGMWYGNNRSADDWCLKAAAQAKDIYGLDMGPEKAFRWITNLENIRDEYDPYPKSERDKIAAMLGVASM